MAGEILCVRHLSKSFGNNLVLKDIDFQVMQADVTSIIGSSGSGKSTLLRCINLLEDPSSGSILFHGKTSLTAAWMRMPIERKWEWCSRVSICSVIFPSWTIASSAK